MSIGMVVITYTAFVVVAWGGLMVDRIRYMR